MDDASRIHTAWTPEQDKLLSELILAGNSYADAGAVLGKSRNACIGRAHRLHIHPPSVVKHQKLVAMRPAKQPREPKPVPLRREPRTPKPVAEAKTEAALQPSRVGVFIWELERAHCRWPLGDPRDIDDFRYCGAPRKETGAYCAGHARMAYEPRKKPVKKDRTAQARRIGMEWSGDAVTR